MLYRGIGSSGAAVEVYVVTLQPENVEADRSQIRTRLGVEKIAERRSPVVTPRDYMGGSVPRGRSENISPHS